MKNKLLIDWDRVTYKENEQAFLDFTACLNEFGIHALFVDFYETNYMSIYVNSIQDVKDAKAIIANECSNIIDSFFATMSKYNIMLVYDRTEWKDYSLGSIYSFEISCIDNIVRKCKDHFINELNEQIKPTPHYVFSHSGEHQNYSRLPGYNLVFKDQSDLKKIVPDMVNRIMIISDKILSHTDKTGFYNKNKIELHYYDAVTNSKSLYGMSRED